VAPELRARLLAEAERHGKAVLVEPVFDTIKLVEGDLVQATLDRDQLRWPVAWACLPELTPPSAEPPAEWFEGAFVLEGLSS
jgi:hypothetical protein